MTGDVGGLSFLASAAFNGAPEEVILVDSDLISAGTAADVVAGIRHMGDNSQITENLLFQPRSLHTSAASGVAGKKIIFRNGGYASAITLTDPLPAGSAADPQRSGSCPFVWGANAQAQNIQSYNCANCLPSQQVA